MKKLLLACFLLSYWTANAQQNLAEKLGYNKTSKLLIIHADDVGLSHSQNEAGFYAMQSGSVNSAAIMVPCPWFPEAAAYARAHPQGDFGLHLTLTSEWKYFKWTPSADKTKIPGLTNKYGFFYESTDSVFKFSNPAEVEKELTAQIERAKLFGLDITHLDSHMAALYENPAYLNVLIKLGRKYKIPVMADSSVLKAYPASFTSKEVVLNKMFTATPPDFKSGMPGYYASVFKEVQPGVSIILLHAAYNDKEMQAITVDHPEWGAAWRQADYDFFTSDECKKLLAENNITLLTWREIRDKLFAPTK